MEDILFQLLKRMKSHSESNPDCAFNCEHKLPMIQQAKALLLDPGISREFALVAYVLMVDDSE